MKASITNYRQSPRKVRLIADLVRGKSIKRAQAELDAMPKRATAIFSKLLQSAVANAVKNFKVSKDGLVIKNTIVNEGRTLKRMRPRSRGMANVIRKRSSHIILELAQSNQKEDLSPKKTTSTPKVTTSTEKPKIKAKAKAKAKPAKSKIKAK